MRKLLLLMLLSLFTFGFSSTSTAQNVFYNRVDTYNSAGINANDFIFTYDGNNVCSNNIKVINNMNYRTTFSFSVYVNSVLKYSGSVNLAAYGSIFFNNAFGHCNSSGAFIRINCW